MPAPGARTQAATGMSPVVPAGVAGESRAVRLAELVEGAVVRFQQRGAEDFEVSIRPDAGTEIRLQVTLRDGSPEVRAELRSGDPAWFAGRWQELQDRLGKQGVRLVGGDGLAGSAAGSDRGTGFASHRPQPSLDDLAPAPGTAPAVGGNAGPSAALRRLLRRGWETWA